MVIYEWSDYHYLGKVTSEIDDYLPVSTRAMPVLATHALMSLVSRKRMYAPQTLCESASANHPILVTSSSTCQLVNPSRIPPSGLQEWPFLAAKSTRATRQVKAFGTILREILHPHQASMLLRFTEVLRRVRSSSTPTPVPLGCSYIVNRYNISSAKLVTTALVCL
jgi:hypothetical protein